MSGNWKGVYVLPIRYILLPRAIIMPALNWFVGISASFYKMHGNFLLNFEIETMLLMSR